MKFHTLLTFLFGIICQTTLWSQVNLSGIINDYAAVQSIDTCLGTLTLGSNAGAFSIGDRILLIQMQGATINETNTAAFGDITNLGSAGFFEVAQISDIQGAVISTQQKLANTYNTNGHVQVVRIPGASSAVVTDTLRCAPWDGNTGGVLVIMADGNLTLNAPIDVSGRGFRGGVSEQLVSECSAFSQASSQFYPSGDWRGAPKGEGIAIITVGKENGRGPQANGGGGGNDHNAGGGGGGNIAKGGIGGSNDEPYFLNCSGDFPGVGSKAVAPTGARILMGGGGGSGHRNNNNICDGGNGGGIVIIVSSSIQSNGHAIKADGASAATVKKDGGGGGGAGGTVVLLSNQLNDGVQISATGGNGGLVNNQNDERCFGPGGGGAGGQVWSSAISNANFSASINGGNAGTTFNSLEDCNNTTVGAVNGENGSVDLFTSIPQGTQPWQQPATIIGQPVSTIVCPSEIATFSITNSDGSFTYQWYVNDGSGFVAISDGSQYNGTASPTLQVLSPSETMSGYAYQCIVLAAGNCFSPAVSQQVTLEVITPTIAAFSYTTNLTEATLNAEQQPGTTYSWNVNGETFTAAAIDYSFPTSGYYTVTLTATGPCGTASSTQVITISVVPEASFSAATTTGCAPAEISFSNEASSGNYLWLFEGGTPAMSMETTPTVTYASSGMYNVTLIVSNDFGSDTLTLNNYININLPPNADFSVNTNVYTVNCVNSSTGGNTYLWEFGDGTNSDSQSPSYTYPAEAGEYVITLTVSNECGSDVSAIAVTIGQLPSAAVGTTLAGGCAPFTTTLVAPGQYVDNWFWSTPGGNPAAATTENVVITYEQPGQYDVSLTVNNPSGSASYELPDFIEVLPFPDANFTLLQSGSTVYFTNTSTDGNDYTWNFGDGSPLEYDFSPQHTYQLGGNFLITLTASNNYCADSYSINFSITDIENSPDNGVTLTPQPSTTAAMLRWQTAIASGTLTMFDAAGRRVNTWQVMGTEQNLDVSDYPAGVYWLTLQAGQWTWSGKLVKQ